VLAVLQISLGITWKSPAKAASAVGSQASGAGWPSQSTPENPPEGTEWAVGSQVQRTEWASKSTAGGQAEGKQCKAEWAVWGQAEGAVSGGSQTAFRVS